METAATPLPLLYARPLNGRAHLLRPPGRMTFCGRNASAWAKVEPCAEVCKLCLSGSEEWQRWRVQAERSRRPHLTWRKRFAPLIAACLADTTGEPPKVVRRRLRELWDDLGMGDRVCWPYKVFRDEVRRQQREGPSPSLADARARRRRARELKAGEGPTLALPFEE